MQNYLFPNYEVSSKFEQVILKFRNIDLKSKEVNEKKGHNKKCLLQIQKIHIYI